MKKITLLLLLMLICSTAQAKIIMDTAGDTLVGQSDTATAITVSVYGIETASGTDTYSKLGQGTLAQAASTTTIYTVPASTSTVVAEIMIANITASAATVSMWHVPNAGAAGDTNILFDIVNVPASSTCSYANGRLSCLPVPVATGAPLDATYITQTANATLTSEQAIGALSSGIMRVATTTGIVSALTNSAGIAANVDDETGTNLLVFSDSPTLVTPALGTPASGVATNLTGTAAGLTAGNVTTNANLTGEVTSVGNAAVLGSFTSSSLLTALSDETGTGVAVFGTAPLFTTDIEVRGAVATPGIGLLSTAELTVVDGDLLGRLNFSAPLESSGGDAVLTAGSIWVEADATFLSGANTSDMIFALGESEAAVEKMRLLSTGRLDVSLDGATAPSISANTVGTFNNSATAGTTANLSIISGNAAGVNLYFGDTDLEAAGAIHWDQGSNLFRFQIGGTSHLTLNGSGNILMNTTSQATAGSDNFNIANGTAPVGALTNGVAFWAQDTNGNPGESGLGFFTEDGTQHILGSQVGIGTITPNQPLTVEGTMSLKEQADANADTLTYGQIWVDTTQALKYTNEDGTDYDLLSPPADAWTDILDAGSSSNIIAFGAYPQGFTANIDGSGLDIFTISQLDISPANEVPILKVETNATNNVNTIFYEGENDTDGTPVVDFQVGGNSIAGSARMMLGSTGVRVTTDGDGALTWLGLSAGADEALTMNLDDTANEVTYSSTTGVVDVRWTGMDINLDDSTFIELDPTPASDHNATGDMASLTTDQDAAIGDLLFLGSDGNYSFADADAATTMPGVVMALETINGDPTPAAGRMLLSGYVRDDTWAWTVGGLIYASVTATTGNTLTQTAPSGTGDQVQVVGYATHADRMYFNPSYVLVEIA
jgi:hypothetical protein